MDDTMDGGGDRCAGGGRASRLAAVCLLSAGWAAACGASDEGDRPGIPALTGPGGGAGGVPTGGAAADAGSDAGATCGDGTVDPGEQCDGEPCCTAACRFVTAGTACRPAADDCDVPEACTGVDAVCPVDTSLPDGLWCAGGWCSEGACTAGNAQHYYVSATDGDDANDGSPGAPWQTIEHADDSLTLGAEGTIVHVAPGTYSCTDYIVTAQNGTPLARIVWLSETRWGALFDGCAWYSDGEYVEIRGFEFTGADVVEALTLRGSFSSALGNYVHDIGHDCHSAGGIATWDVGHDFLVDGNVVANLAVGFIDPDFRCNQYHGIYPTGERVTVRNNIVSGAPGWGIHVWHDSSDLIIMNNTVFHNGLGGIIVGNGDNTDGPYVVDNTTVNNNIVVDNGWGVGPTAGIIEYGGDCTKVGANNVYENNLAYGNTPTDYELCGGKVPASPISLSADEFAGLFVSYANDGTGDYHLKTGARAVDHGTTSCTSGTSDCAPLRDFDSVVRPKGAGYDTGAYESF